MKFNLKNLIKDKFVLGTFFLTFANFGGAIFNYLVHPILTRHLTIAAYGDFQALLSFVTILSVLATVINTTLIKEFSALRVHRPGEINSLRKHASNKFFWLGVATFVLILFFLRPLNEMFKISEGVILILASLSFLYLFPLMVNRAVLSAWQDFPALALNGFLDPFFRILFIFLLVVVWPLDLTGAAWALGVAGIMPYLASLYQVKRLRLPSAQADFQPTLRHFKRYSLLVLWFMALSQFFYSFDMLLVKSFFSPEEAGLYGALLTIGRIIFFVGGAVPLVMFPVVANLKKEERLRRFAILAKSLSLMFLLALPAYAIIAIWPDFIIRVIVGVKYLPIVGYLPGFALVMLLFTLVTVLSNYFLALADRRSLVILSFAALAEVAMISLFHYSLSVIILSLGVVFGATSLALLALVYLSSKQD